MKFTPNFSAQQIITISICKTLDHPLLCLSTRNKNRNENVTEACAVVPRNRLNHPPLPLHRL
ncbi:hypothetical protein NC652_023173 [Populus alba x Populus x berolinensis]|nr:hypothetical protein NC652_023173 [Populus alba x Populus x berolinensis]